MAVALFGAVVTIILSAQAGLVASDRTATNISQAIELARCRMSEIEEKELKLGYPEIEEKDTSLVCCNETQVTGFSCDWRVERVLLPQPQNLGGDAGLSSVLSLGLEGGAGGLGGLGAAASALQTPGGPIGVNPAGGATLDFDAGLANIGNTIGQSFGGAGVSGLLSLVFGIVYPSLKPVLEAAIRKVTVVVKWREGLQDRDFTLVQYVTNPSRSGLLAALADGGALGEGGGLPTNVGPSALPQSASTGGIPVAR